MADQFELCPDFIFLNVIWGFVFYNNYDNVTLTAAKSESAHLHPEHGHHIMSSDML
jgi:hypothetical protein